MENIRNYKSQMLWGQIGYSGSHVLVQTAQNAGVDCIAAGWGFRSIEVLQQAGAKKILVKPIELLDHL